MKRNEKKLKLMLCVSLTLLVLISSGCKGHPDAPKLEHSPRLYATDSQAQQVFRIDHKDENGQPVYETHQTSNKEFDKFICIRIDEYTKAKNEIVDLTWKCEKWTK